MILPAKWTPFVIVHGQMVTNPPTSNADNSTSPVPYLVRHLFDFHLLDVSPLKLCYIDPNWRRVWIFSRVYAYYSVFIPTTWFT